MPSDLINTVVKKYDYLLLIKFNKPFTPNTGLNIAKLARLSGVNSLFKHSVGTKVLATLKTRLKRLFFTLQKCLFIPPYNLLFAVNNLYLFDFVAILICFSYVVSNK